MPYSNILGKVQNLKSRYKTLIAFLSDTFFIVLCFYLSVAIRYGAIIPSEIDLKKFGMLLLTVSIIQSITLYINGLYKGIWRYSSTPDLVRLIKGASMAVAFSTAFIFVFNRLDAIPRSAIVIDWLLLIVTLGGTRFTYRILADMNNDYKSSDSNKVLIYGTGSSAEQLFREIRSADLGLRVIGFLDDNTMNHNRHIHGVPVFGNKNKIPGLDEKYDVSMILIAQKNASSQLFRDLVDICVDLDVKIKTIPNRSEFLGGKSHLSQLRNVEPEDLLGREEVVLETETIEEMLHGNVILVSGAGGSIGSELCRQISRFNPSSLILFEQSEYNLYALEKDLKAKFPELKYSCVIGDVRNKSSLEMAFVKHKPDIVFHAAAYKHVPLMEENPSESIQTNILGTKAIAEVSNKFNVKKFVLISTDKAVNPTNVMGATKRIAEMVCLNTQKQPGITKFMMVRFGNVLGSSGSVIPLFKKQIEEGGPVTVTHKEVERYFMSIPEASRLVLQAGAMGTGGEIFLLEMGNSVKIVDLAKQMIALSGLRVGHDIDIKFTGLRPGEKLYEELLVTEENMLPTAHPLVKVAKSREVPSSFEDNLGDLINTLSTSAPKVFRERIKNIVTDYNPQNTEQVDKNFEELCLKEDSELHEIQ